MRETRSKIKNAYKNGEFDYKHYKEKTNIMYDPETMPLQYEAYNTGFEYAKQLDEIMKKAFS